MTRMKETAAALAAARMRASAATGMRGRQAADSAPLSASRKHQNLCRMPSATPTIDMAPLPGT
jgi:hypothetical protein